jgi:hypothetical protein
MTDPQIATSSNLTPRKKRGRNKSTLSLIVAVRQIAEDGHPITGRGIGYKLFARGLIDSMSTGEMGKVYRALKIAREEGTVPWHWIVDETRDLELIRTWRGPSQCASGFFYRRDLWQTQEHAVEVWSEKGTVRGVLWPVLARLGVGFRVMHGFSSATSVYDVSNNGNDDRPLIALYIGDYDPSGLFMSEVDLPARIAEYGGDHVELRRIALTEQQTRELSSFPVESKRKDPRFKWFKQNHGLWCWELDAMDPGDLRALVESEIELLIDREAWSEQERLEAREKQSIEVLLRTWANMENLRIASEETYSR